MLQYYFVPAVFVVQWVIMSKIWLHGKERHSWGEISGSSKNNGQSRIDGSRKTNPAFEKNTLSKVWKILIFFRNDRMNVEEYLHC